MSVKIDREKIRQSLTGPIMSICSPFLPAGDVDFEGLQNIIDFGINAGSKTMLLTAGDSHYVCLSDQEIAQITKITCQQTAGRAMVVAADRYHSTARAIEFAKYAAEHGAEVLMCLPPDWGASCTPQSLADHYHQVSRHIPVMIVTNVFNSRGIEFGLKTLQLTLEQADGVVAIKDDMCGEFGRRMAMLVHDSWAVMSGGEKQNHIAIWPYGCDGYLSTFMSFKPEISHHYWQAIQANDLTAAIQVIKDYEIPFNDFTETLTGTSDAAMHGALELFGLAKRWRRKPYYSLNDQEMERLADFFKSKSLL